MSYQTNISSLAESILHDMPDTSANTVLFCVDDPFEGIEVIDVLTLDDVIDQAA